MRIANLFVLSLLMACPAAAQDYSAAVAPLGNAGTWVTHEDYPAVELRAEIEGLVGLELALDATGRPTACSITETSGSSALDEAACAKLMERGRFRPATDASGEPVAGTFSTSIRWRIQPTEVPEPGAMAFSFVVERDGSVTGCQVERAEGSGEKLAEQMCPTETFEPIFDDRGDPVRTLIRSEFSVTHEHLPE